MNNQINKNIFNKSSIFSIVLIIAIVLILLQIFSLNKKDGQGISLDNSSIGIDSLSINNINESNKKINNFINNDIDKNKIDLSKKLVNTKIDNSKINKSVDSLISLDFTNPDNPINVNSPVILKNGIYDINTIFLKTLNPKEIILLANDYKINKDFRISVGLYNYIIDNFPDSVISPEAQWQIADIYINDLNDYIIGIEHLYKIVNNYPLSTKSENALFMIGYIFNNSLNAYSDAILVYNEFINAYPKSELLPSVEYELNNLVDLNMKINEMLE